MNEICLRRVLTFRSFLSTGLARIFLACPLALFAGIHLRTNIQDVVVNQKFAELGSITVSLHGNHFPTASETEPVFLRIHLNNGHRLAQTLVNVESSTTHCYPVFLGLKLYSSFPEATIAADPDTVSIIRWIRGEQDIWLRIQSPSSSWIEMDGQLFAPSEKIGHCEVTLGISGLTSLNSMQNPYAAGRANRPSNARNDSQLAIETDYVSTLLIAELAHLGAYPEEDCLTNFTVSQYSSLPTTNHETTNFPIEGPNLEPQGFTQDHANARGWNLSSYGYCDNYSGAPYPELCESNSENGLIANSYYLETIYVIDHQYDWDYLLHYYLIVSTPPNSDYGFKVGTHHVETTPSKTEWWGNNPMGMETQDYYDVEDIGIRNDPYVISTRTYDDGSFFTTPGGELLTRTVLVESSGWFFEVTDLDYTVYQDFRSPPQKIEFHVQAFIDANAAIWYGESQWIQGSSQMGGPPDWMFAFESDADGGGFYECQQGSGK